MLWSTAPIESRILGASSSLRLSTFGVVLFKRLSLVGAGSDVSGFGLFLLPSGLPLPLGTRGAGGGRADCATSG